MGTYCKTPTVFSKRHNASIAKTQKTNPYRKMLQINDLSDLRIVPPLFLLASDDSCCASQGRQGHAPLEILARAFALKIFSAPSTAMLPPDNVYNTLYICGNN